MLEMASEDNEAVGNDRGVGYAVVVGVGGVRRRF